MPAADRSPHSQPRVASPFAEHSLAEWQQRAVTLLDPAERGRAFQAIVALSAGSPAAFSDQHPLLPGLVDADPEIRGFVLRQLRRLLVIAATPADAGSSDSPPVTRRCPEAWAKAAAPLLRDADPDVQFAAAALLEHSLPHRPAVQETLTSLWARTAELAELDWSNLVELIQVSQALEPGSDRVAETFSGLLAHDRPEVREAVLRLLINWGFHGVRWEPQIIDLLDDEDPLVREQAVLALEAQGPATDVALIALQLSATDEDECVAAAALRVLAKNRPPI